MNIDTYTIDRIVAGVLNQLGTGGDGASALFTTDVSVSREASPSVTGETSTVITTNVITADVLIDALTNESHIVVSERAIITPAAWDAAKERGVEIKRQSPRATPRGSSGGKSMQRGTASDTHGASPVGLGPLLVVVRNTDAVERLWDDMNSTWQRELLGCPDEAASLAISAVCRGETLTVVILAEQTHRAACLANRNERISAVVARDAGDVRAIKKQLRANVWCIDPTGCSWFELRNIFTAISNN